jgi:hypothetical protein
MKYRIIGADGKMYGPVELDQIRRWLAAGRVDSRTPVYLEGAVNWTYLGLLPELATEFTAPPAAPPPPTIGALRPAGAARGTNGFATAGLVCGILAWVPCCCCLPFNLFGLIFSLIALLQISGQAEPQEGRAFAIVGLVLSGGSLLFSCIAALGNLLLTPGSLMTLRPGQIFR